ncbi:MAG: cytochrome c [Deltaproteobacteria bacterium]|nr:cytochrome c [Deltaproteobacteria bacterium]
MALALLSACGPFDEPATGQALTDSASESAVALRDSSSQAHGRAAAVHADRSFTVDVAGLETPFLLRVEWTDAGAVRRFYAVSEGRGNLDVNALTDVAFRGVHDGTDESLDDAADDEVFERADPAAKRAAAARARSLLANLGAALAPLLVRYGIADPRTDRDAVRVLLRDVRVTKDRRAVGVTNRASGKVIFTGLLSGLPAGTFNAAAMPAGPNGPATCTAFSYSGYGPCQPDGTQTRTVVSSSPEGCAGGSPLLTQACTYVPPVVVCTAFTYSDYGPCLDGRQTRTVLTSLPPGCTGGSPDVSRACQVVPPPIDGAALYAQYCYGCHGNAMKGKSASKIQRAIDRDTGGMGTAALRALTPAQIAAIAAAR